MPAEKSGAHIGAIRNWIQWNCVNGDAVTWDSDDILQLRRNLTPKLLEGLAQKIADAVIDDPRLVTVDKLQDRWEKAGYPYLEISTSTNSAHQILVIYEDESLHEYLAFSDALSTIFRKLKLSAS
jgi:hypothetical protein